MSFTDLISRLDARPGVRGRQFERICAWFLRNAPEYRGRFKKVWLWADGRRLLFRRTDLDAYLQRDEAR